MTHLTPAAKEALRKTIRGLRAMLIAQLSEAAEREYRLGVSIEKAKLSEAVLRRRERLEAWLEEQSRADFPKDKKGAVKAPSEKALSALRERYLGQAVKEAAHTLINRLVMLRMLEAGGLSKPAVLSGGFKSSGYREFQAYAGALCSDPGDDTKGYGALLQLVFDELSIELPGLFGQVGLTSLFPVPAATLREVVEALNDAALDTAWGDDTTLGWVYQFYNDPEREALDDKINGGGKIEPHEIASKTQMFTERYMVEWLLQNSLGQTWLAMCKKKGWTPDFEQVRDKLEARRAEWRKQREAGEVAPDELMPLESPLEDQWKYWVPQLLPADAVASAPERLLDLKLLDPACGSGHFLVIAFDLLGALYREEARLLGVDRSDQEIAADIVEHNLHGIDIDPRAIQIAAAALWLKAKLFAPGAVVQRMNLVAPTFKLAALSSDDPALVQLQKRLKVEVGINEALTTSLVDALSGVDHLGTLLRVDKDVRAALAQYQKVNFGLSAPKAQTTMFGEAPKEKIQVSLDEAEANVMEQLARFLDAHEGEGDLGLRLEGEQLAAGVRFLEIAQEGKFDVVVGNPPYQGTSKMAEAAWFKKHYPRSKADLYACFLERGLELAKPGGVSALLTMRGWMFLSSYQELREGLLKEQDLMLLGDIDRGGFEDIPDEVVAASMSLFAKRHTEHQTAVAIQPTPLDDKTRDSGRTTRKKAALLSQVGRFEFDVAKLAGIEGTPLVYWWDEEFLEEYVKAPKLGDVAPVKQGMATADNVRFLRYPWEIELSAITLSPDFLPDLRTTRWVPYVKGAKGRAWLEDVYEIVNWEKNALAIKTMETDGEQSSRPQNEQFYFRKGVAFSSTGAAVKARHHRYRSVFDVKGQSVFPSDANQVCANINSSVGRMVLQSLNPTVSFQVGDALRLPMFTLRDVAEIQLVLNQVFTIHESHREPSVEFKCPGPSPWRYAQEWAQRAVDRPKGAPLPTYGKRSEAAGRSGLSTAADHVGGAGAQPVGGEEESEFTSDDGGGLYTLKNTVAQRAVDRPKGEPLPPYEEVLEAPDPLAPVSFAIGVALGRFGENGEGILDLNLEAEDAASGSAPTGQDAAKDASLTQTKALPGVPGQPQTGAKNSKAAQNALISDVNQQKEQFGTHSTAAPEPLANGEQFARSVQKVAKAQASADVPNIEPSPLPAGQEILPDGILFVSAALHVDDSFMHPAAARIEAAWNEAATSSRDGAKKSTLNEWLRKDFFAHHKSLYENRPIYFPLSSSGKSFVAWVSIHRWVDNTLQSLLASYLHPARQKLEGEINDLNEARASSDKAAQSAAEKQYSKTQKLFEELSDFIREVTHIAEKGAPPADGKCPPREVDAPFRMDLDDGVMINSAALWPLLLPQWKDPKKWWKELCVADGRKDYDWAHLSKRYFPARVDEKCKEDPSLGVAHGCFWRYHPHKAYAWELRLQDEIGPGFTIDEADSDRLRAEFLAAHPADAREIEAKEEQRRERHRKKAAKGAAGVEDAGAGDSDEELAQFELRAE